MASTIKIKILGDASGFKKATDDASGAIGALEKATGGIAGKIGAAFAGIGVANFAKNAVDLASGIGESFSKLNVLVGDSAKGINDWAKSTGRSIGIAQADALEAAGNFANMFQIIGKSGPEVADMSKQMVQLAADMASFNNASIEETLEAIAAGLRGESEPLRRFGVALDDATLRQKALDMGLVKTTKETLPPAIKMQAAYGVILDQTSKQQGDFARTSDGLANQQRILAASFKDMQTRIGAGLLPVAGQLVDKLNDAIPVLEEMIGSVFDLAGKFGGLAGPLAETGGALAVFLAGAAGAGKAVEGLNTVRERIQALAGSASTLSGTFGLLGGAVAGLAALGFVKASIDAAETKRTTDDLAEALRQAGDPTQQLTDWLGELSSELKSVKANQEDAGKEILTFDAAWAAGKAERDKTIEQFNRAGISAQKMAELAKAGGRAFGDAASLSTSSMKDLEQQISELDATIAGADDGQAKFIRSLFDMARQGKISQQDLQVMLGTLADLSEAYNTNRDQAAKTAKEAAQLAVATGKVTQAWLDEQNAANKSRTETDRWIAVGEALKKQLEATGQAAEDTAAATDKLGDANAATKQSVEELTAAVEAEREAHEKRTEALLESFDVQAAYDRSLDEMADSTEALTRSQIELEVAVNSYGEESEEAYQASIDYRDALRDAQGAARDAANEAVKLAEKNAEVAGTTLDASAKTDIYRGKLIEIRDAAGDPALRAYLDGLISQLYQQESASWAAGSALSNLAARMREAAAAAANMTSAGQIVGSADSIERAVSGSRATGGMTFAGQAYRVGESGPEVFVPQQNGRVLSPAQVQQLANQALAGPAAGGGEQVLVVNLHLDGKQVDQALVRPAELRRRAGS